MTSRGQGRTMHEEAGWSRQEEVARMAAGVQDTIHRLWMDAEEAFDQAEDAQTRGAWEEAEALYIMSHRLYDGAERLARGEVV